jgi:GT2 family glycosyltransferase
MIPVLGVPTLNRHDLCDRMLASIDYPVQDVIVVDNAPNDWTPTKPELVKRIHHIRMPQNLGVAASWNLIIKASPFAPSWIIVNDDVVFEPGSLETMSGELRSDVVQFFQVSPRWAAFAIGEKVVERVGLFCELYHPAYFEDTDYERRMFEHEMDMEIVPAPVHHDNSSTLKSGYDIQNHKTFRANSLLNESRERERVLTGGEWDLTTRRELTWD